MDGAENSKFKILIVDDIPKNIQIVGNILREEGYNIAFAQNGKMAVSMAKSRDFDLILLDVMMPGMDGFEVCKILQEDEKARETPIIFLTAKVDSESAIKAFDVGGVDYITKPFNSRELVARARTHLQLRAARRNLVEANAELRELNAAKDRFFSIIAHDLKNPIGAFKNILNVLNEDFASFSEEEILEFINDLTASSKNLFELIENLLEWSRAQTGRIQFNPDRNDLFHVVKNTLSIVKLNAEEKKIKLSSNIEENSVAVFDANMIQTVLRNLVSNAIKFTPEGGSIDVLLSERDENFYEIVVKDSGVGISQDNIDKLFRIDQHHTTMGTNDEKGTGLGLILCSEFVKKHGGEIKVESLPGEGSKFSFTVPRENIPGENIPE